MVRLIIGKLTNWCELPKHNHEDVSDDLDLAVTNEIHCQLT